MIKNNVSTIVYINLSICLCVCIILGPVSKTHPMAEIQKKTMSVNYWSKIKAKFPFKILPMRVGVCFFSCSLSCSSKSINGKPFFF